MILTMLLAALMLVVPALTSYLLKSPTSKSFSILTWHHPFELLGVFYGFFMVDVLLFWFVLYCLKRTLNKGDEAGTAYVLKLVDQTMSAAVILGLTGTATSIFSGFAIFVKGEGQIDSAQAAIKAIFSGGIAVALATTVVGMFLSLLMDLTKAVLVEREAAKLLGDAFDDQTLD